MCSLMTNSIKWMVLIVILLLVVQFHIVCKQLSIDCTSYDDPLPISHGFYQSGDLFIGEMVGHIVLLRDTPSFREQPTLNMGGELL